MNGLDIAGLLQTYALKIQHCNDKEKVIELIKDLKSELKIKEIRKEWEEENE